MRSWTLLYTLPIHTTRCRAQRTCVKKRANDETHSSPLENIATVRSIDQGTTPPRVSTLRSLDIRHLAVLIPAPCRVNSGPLFPFFLSFSLISLLFPSRFSFVFLGLNITLSISRSRLSSSFSFASIPRPRVIALSFSLSSSRSCLSTLISHSHLLLVLTPSFPFCLLAALSRTLSYYLYFGAWSPATSSFFQSALQGCFPLINCARQTPTYQNIYHYLV